MPARVPRIRRSREHAPAPARRGDPRRAAVPSALPPEPTLCAVRRTILADSSAPGVAREALSEVVDSADSSTRYRAQLLVSELVSHVTKTVSEGPHRLDMAFSVSAGRLRVEVAADEECPILTGAEPNSPALGWELQVVAKVADRWGIRSGGSTMLWFELEL
jgi:hypothetical protein